MLYDVRLDGFDGDEIVIIDLCMTVCGFDANTAYMIVDNMPSIIAHNVDMNQAKKLKKAFEYEGAFIEITTPFEECTIPTKMEPSNRQSAIDNEFDINNEINLDDKDDDGEDGIDLEKVFEDHTGINMKPNDYGDYALDKLEKDSEDDNDKIDIQNESNPFSDTTSGYEFMGEKSAYNNLESMSKQYISKRDLEKMGTFKENEDSKMNNLKASYNNLSGNIEDNASMIDKHNNKSDKQYISKEYLENRERFENNMEEQAPDKQQEIVANDNTNFLNIGTPYDKNSMQINTFRNTDEQLDSSAKNMKNLYDKKAAKTIDDPDVANSEWFKIIKKNINDNSARNTNDYQKEQMVCPKCGSSFVSSKKSQGFFGTKKIKYVCEACKHKF